VSLSVQDGRDSRVCDDEGRVVAVSGLADVTSCPRHWLHVKQTTSCYVLFNTKTNQAAASSYCRSVDASLVSVQHIHLLDYLRSVSLTPSAVYV